MARRKTADWTRPLARQLRLSHRPKPVILKTLQDAAGFILEMDQGDRTVPIWLEMAAQLMHAATTGKAADIAAATDQMEEALTKWGYIPGPTSARR